MQDTWAKGSVLLGSKAAASVTPGTHLTHTRGVPSDRALMLPSQAHCSFLFTWKQ